MWCRPVAFSTVRRITVLCRGYMWNKLFWNNIEIISVFYFTCNYHGWLRLQQNTEMILKLYECCISHVTKIISAAEIIW